MAQPDFVTTPPIRAIGPKPRMTIYYALLIIALGAILMGCLFLYLEIRRFGGFGAVTGRVAKAEMAAPVFIAGRPPALPRGSWRDGQIAAVRPHGKAVDWLV